LLDFHPAGEKKKLKKKKKTINKQTKEKKIFAPVFKVAPYSFTIARALATKVQAICARSKGNVSVFLYFITST